MSLRTELLEINLIRRVVSRGQFEIGIFLRGERENRRQLQEIQSLLLLEAGRKTVSIDL
jgi:hypothetical protein